ncbi:PQQ-binding-like beta-propeller repeat protein [Halorarius litoreus]|uniref:outer membrane protein assembly factor BamB family protein n=1 Tax=Halorarius litoreus TaxID=2962676 RepID=UPI0020CE973C|nr:PQQ-binding-like beta-propeller repeat protein [Halorarius litoreus]
MKRLVSASLAHTRLAVALALLVVLAGCAGGVDAPGSDGSETPEVELVERWTAGTSTIEGNHHAAVAGRVDGEPVVAVPIGGHHGENGCELLVLDGAGETRWREAIPPEACTIHAVADPSLADFLGASGGDSRPELYASTTENAVLGFDPLTGEQLFRYNLSDYGYTRPVVADVIGDDTEELVVTDVDGELSVVRPDGSVVWRRPLNAYSWSAPAVANFDAQGGKEVVVGLGNGTAIAFTPRGGVAWTATVDGSITWTADGNVDDDPARELLVATAAGEVAAIDGASGEVEWSRTVEKFAAVGAPFDGDDDGDIEVYAADESGTLYALSGATGETEWTTTLTDAEVQMTPPPVAGDATGDGVLDLIATTNDGGVLVVDPADGTIRARYDRDAAIYTHATLADTDGDGTQEVYVVYGDGRAVALTVHSSSSS